MIRQIADSKEKQVIARTVLEALPEWFGILEAREDYIAKSAAQTFLVRLTEKNRLAFCALPKRERIRWSFLSAGY